MTVYIGIDPGRTGAIVVLDAEGKLISASLCPCTAKDYDDVAMSRLIALATVGEDAFAGLERVGTRPGESLRGAFTFGEGVGIWRGALAGEMIGWKFVMPQAWQQRALSGERRPKVRKELKDAITRSAMRRWPELSERLALKKNQGIADAAWIAEHTRLSHQPRSENQ